MRRSKHQLCWGGRACCVHRTVCVQAWWRSQGPAQRALPPGCGRTFSLTPSTVQVHSCEGRRASCLSCCCWGPRRLGVGCPCADAAPTPAKAAISQVCSLASRCLLTAQAVTGTVHARCTNLFELASTGTAQRSATTQAQYCNTRQPHTCN
jgi:hypothetical protein